MNDKNIISTFISIRENLVGLVSGIVPPKEIEDIVQETYVRACQAEKLRKITSPRTFMYRTARNLAFDYIKKAETRLCISDSSEEVSRRRDGYGEANETLDKVCSDEKFARFCDAVRHLPKECRKIFVLKKVYGYSQREIAKEFGLSESTVEKQVAQGIKRCRYFMMQVEKHSGVSEQEMRGQENESR